MGDIVLLSFQRNVQIIYIKENKEDTQEMDGCNKRGLTQYL